MNNYFKLFGIVFVLIMFAGSTTSVSFSEYVSPRVQIESGVAPEDVQCRDDRVLVLRTNGSTACVQESTAEKMNWNVIATEFNVLVDTISDPLAEKPQTDKSFTQNTEQELTFAISSDVEFDGELYGYYDPTVLRRPAPTEKSTAFGIEHYDVKQAVKDSTSLLASGQLTTQTLLEQLVTSSSVHENSIDYTQWLPTKIPDGFELNWIDIDQPEVYFYNNVGKFQASYIPNTIDISGKMMVSEAADMPSIHVVVFTHPFDDDPFSQKRIDRVTGNGASTKVLIEEKYGGILETIVESPADPNVKGFRLFLNEYSLDVLGRGVSLDELEKIFLEILERH